MISIHLKVPIQDVKQLPDNLTSSNIIKSHMESNFYRKAKLTDAKVKTQTKTSFINCQMTILKSVQSTPQTLKNQTYSNNPDYSCLSILTWLMCSHSKLRPKQKDALYSIFADLL